MELLHAGDNTITLARLEVLLVANSTDCLKELASSQALFWCKLAKLIALLLFPEVGSNENRV